MACGTQLSLSPRTTHHPPDSNQSRNPKYTIRQNIFLLFLLFLLLLLPSTATCCSSGERKTRPSRVGSRKPEVQHRASTRTHKKMLDEGTLSWNARYERELDVIARRHSPVSAIFISCSPSSWLQGCVAVALLLSPRQEQKATSNATCPFMSTALVSILRFTSPSRAPR